MLLIGAFILISTVQAQDILYKYTTEYDQMWNDKGSGGDNDVSIWRPKATGEWCSLGDVAVGHYSKPTTKALLVKSSNEAVEPPVGFTSIWKDRGSGADWDVTVWRMDAPFGYTCLGDVATRSYSTKPKKSNYCCVKNNYVVLGELDETYNDKGTGAWDDFSIWTVKKLAKNNGLYGGNFRSHEDHGKPDLIGYLLAKDGVNVVRARK